MLCIVFMMLSLYKSLSYLNLLSHTILFILFSIPTPWLTHRFIFLLITLIFFSYNTHISVLIYSLCIYSHQARNKGSLSSLQLLFYLWQDAMKINLEASVLDCKRPLFVVIVYASSQGETSTGSPTGQQWPTSWSSQRQMEGQGKGRWGCDRLNLSPQGRKRMGTLLGGQY